jgi:hypothetical protein
MAKAQCEDPLRDSSDSICSGRLFSPDGKLLVLRPRGSYERASSYKEKSSRNRIDVQLFAGVPQHRLQAEDPLGLLVFRETDTPEGNRLSKA